MSPFLLSTILLLYVNEPQYPSLPEAVSSLGAVVCDGYVYTYGGHAGKRHSYSRETTSGKFRRLSLANPATGWQELPGGRKLQGLALVTNGSKIYRIGGMEPRNAKNEPADCYSTSECAVFDPATKQWSPLPSLPNGRSSHDAVQVENTLVVVGGWHQQGLAGKPIWHDTVFVMDLSQPAPKWESTPQPFRRRALQIVANNGRVYCIGGLTPDGEIDKEVEVFDVARRTWSTAPPLPGPMMNGFAPGVAVSQGTVFASPADGTVYRLTESAWEPVGKLLHKRFVHRLVTLPDGSLLALGGADQQGAVAQVEHVVVDAITRGGTEKAVTNEKQKNCPVMTGVPVDEESITVNWEGVPIRLCCKSCLKKWSADPEAYLRPETLPQLRGRSLPKQKLEQIYCPVYRNRVVSEKDPYAEYQGVKVYFYNQSAKEKFLKQPSKYADVELLPQLRARGR